MSTNHQKTKTLSLNDLNGANILLKCLLHEGVKHIWACPGDAVLPLFEAFTQFDSLEPLVMRHEQATIHAADGYARATGNVGVAVIPSGAGVTSAATGIATAYMDSSPLVIISGQVRSQYIGEDACQECDAIGITRPIVKHNILVNTLAELPLALKKAFHIASTGRPGPVLVDVPHNIWLEKSSLAYPKKIEMRSYEPVLKGHTGQIKKALALLLSKQRPCLYIGGGVITANATESFAKILSLLDMPVVSSMMGLGGCPSTDPRFLGMMGSQGVYEANMAMQECDVMLALGVRFNDRAIADAKHYMDSRERKIIHVDIDPSSISKRIKADIPIVGDVKDVIDEMLLILEEQKHEANTKKLASWWKQINQWRKSNCLDYDRATSAVIKPQKVIETLWDMTYKDDVFICSDVGRHQLWLAQYYRFLKPRHWISSGGFGGTGAGLPFALGVKKAFSKSEVFCVSSEASIQKNIQELASSTHHQLPVIILILNNSYLGMSQEWHVSDHKNSQHSSYISSLPDFVKLAQSYGHVGMLVEQAHDVESALIEARKVKNKSVILDIRTDPTERIFEAPLNRMEDHLPALSQQQEGVL